MQVGDTVTTSSVMETVVPGTPATGLTGLQGLVSHPQGTIIYALANGTITPIIEYGPSLDRRNT